ncbi:MAG: enoyl-CoA hydratase/isomerase family protein, partial [Longimicrobiales bacterium]
MSPRTMDLLFERDGAIATLTLNRPDRLNAVSLPLYRALIHALTTINRDVSLRAVVLTGAGRAFCVGADLKAHDEAEPSLEDKRVYVRTAQRAHRRMQRLSKPIVAAVNGHAIGAGLELALSCDFVLVAEEAKLRFPEIAIGTFVGGGTVYTLPRRVGLLRARELLLLGEFFSAHDAVSWGIANRAVAAEQVLPAALELAEKLARRAPRSMAHARRLLNHAQQMDTRRALALEAAALL